MKPPRHSIPKDVETQVLVATRRRCCLCYFIKEVRTERPGQIAHLRGDRSRCSFDDLVYLCLEHHDEFDGSTSQSKGLTPGEVKHHRNNLYEELARSDLASIAATSEHGSSKSPALLPEHAVESGAQRPATREEPAVRVFPATSDSRQEGFVWVYNPGVAEEFCVRIAGFSATSPGLELKATWSTGHEERVLKKGDKDWCRIMTLEPDRVRMSFSRQGEPLIPLGSEAALQRENDRHRRGVRMIRFLGRAQNSDIEVAQGNQYVAQVVVLSDTREPVRAQVTYGVHGHKLVMPFDQNGIDALLEEERKLRVEIGKFMNRSAQEEPDSESAE